MSNDKLISSISRVVSLYLAAHVSLGLLWSDFLPARSLSWKISPLCRNLTKHAAVRYRELECKRRTGGRGGRGPEEVRTQGQRGGYIYIYMPRPLQAAQATPQRHWMGGLCCWGEVGGSWAWGWGRGVWRVRLIPNSTADSAHCFVLRPPLCVYHYQQ